MWCALPSLGKALEAKRPSEDKGCARDIEGAILSLQVPEDEVRTPTKSLAADNEAIHDHREDQAMTEPLLDSPTKPYSSSGSS